MIDIEAKVYDTVSTAVLSSYPTADVSSLPIENPPKFPHISCYEISNIIHNETGTLGGIENHARIGFQIDIFSNQQATAKSVCKNIASVVDTAMIGMGFSRNFASQTPNVDRTVYRYTLRYEAIVAKGIQSGNNIKYVTYIQ